MLTGKYAWRVPGTGVAAGNAGMIIRPETYTLADVFKNSGYITGAIGKWHLGLGDKSGMQDWNAPLPTALGDLGFETCRTMSVKQFLSMVIITVVNYRTIVTREDN